MVNTIYLKENLLYWFRRTTFYHCQAGITNRFQYIVPGLRNHPTAYQVSAGTTIKVKCKQLLTAGLVPTDN